MSGDIKASFRKHDEVLLSIGEMFVGSGSIVKVLPADILEGETLGDYRVAVLIDAVFDLNIDLPYPTTTILKLKDAKDKVILWDKAYVKLTQDTTTTYEADNSSSAFLPDSQGGQSPTLHSLGAAMEVPREEFEMEPPFPVDITQTYHSEPTQQSTTFRPTTDTGDDGDEVYLYNKLACKVGRGIVHHVDAAKTCHSVQIGIENISVRILEVIDGHEDDPLPFPHDGADTLGESIGVPVKWSKTHVCKIGDAFYVTSSATNVERTYDKANSDAGSSDNEKHNVFKDGVDYSQRRYWHLKDVDVYNPTRVIVIASGKISVSSAIDAVNDKVLGDDNVGVTLIHIHQKEYFPHVASGDAMLVAWPIHSVKLVDDGRFLGDIMKEVADDSDESTQIILEPMNRGKRAYHSTKRTKMDPEAKRLRDQEKKKNKKLDLEEINLARGSECCGLKCCQITTVEEFLEVRSEFWLASYANRKTNILALFHTRSKELIANNRMVLQNCIVCKRGFHTIFGFSHTQFYKYEKCFLEGQKVGFHGNEGQLKSRENTLLAKAMLENILKAIGEPMPHLTYNGSKGTDNIEYKLPSSMTKKCVYEELSTAMSAENLLQISKSTFHTIWNDNFANYKMHTTSAFSKCEECLVFKAALQSERRAVERKQLESKREIHLRQQMSRRHTYYTARILAVADPQNCLCIIHDKMDQNKTWLPRMANTPKSLGKSNPLPISLTGMITHGRAPGAYAHYGLTGLWSSDPDFTITSITKCLRDLEEYSGDKSGHLGNDVHSDSHPIFSQLMDKKAFEVAYLTPKNITVERFRGLEDQIESTEGSTSTCSFKPLPKHLVLQLDNSAKDNKNQTVMAFCSNLVARGIFETVTMSFLMVGHTHEDIDATFSKVSLRTKGKNIDTMPQLMAEVWECMTELHMVPSMITEVADYKAYLRMHKVKNIVGHSLPVSFRFSMIDNKPVYQYKESIKSSWTPEKGRCIWATDLETRKLIVPVDDPLAKNMSNTYEKKDEVVPYIRKYIEYHSKTCLDVTSDAYRIKAPLIMYWKNLADTLQGKFGSMNHGSQAISENVASETKLPYPFWPKTNHGTGYILHDPQSMDN